MPDIKFYKHDGQIRLGIGGEIATLEGDGNISYRSRVSNKISTKPDSTSKTIKILKIVALIATIVSAIGALVFLIWQWKSGASTPAAVSMSAKIFGFTLIGSLLSFGGVNLFSMKAEIGSLQESLTPQEDCPFIDLYKSNDESYSLHKPGNPHVCRKCPLGIDINPNVEGTLIHNCRVYPRMHEEWLMLPKSETMI